MSENLKPRASMTRAAKSYIVVNVAGRAPGTTDVVIDGETFVKSNGLPLPVGSGMHLVQVAGAEERLVDVYGTKDRPMAIDF